MAPERRIGIYVNFESLSIIRYIELLIDNMFTAQFYYYNFNEFVSPSLGGDEISHN